ncbi:MAG: prepilin-type N-terminal cleavage/methylation domain-containing protein [Rhodopirellula sp. JB044]|uniref:prepilin-type N-terminal cleavage/methylation domain-containing protein n=1 Tax=Rhodopirellula sp. JB044 TaxID=3342844 RepID=UPI00370C1A63
MNGRARKRSNRLPMGYTLLEVLLVLTLVSSLLAGVGGLITIVQKSTNASKKSFLVRRDLRRFADDFRDDAHSAATAVVEQERLTLSRVSSVSTVVYRIEPQQHVKREVFDDEQRLVAQDTYAIARDGKIRFESENDNTLVRCTILERDRMKNPAEIVAILRSGT